MKKLLTLLLACVLFASNLNAGGFQINEHGARAMSLGGAFTGLANDPSAIYFNPAGLTQFKGTRFYFGTTAISPSATYTSGSGSLTKEYEMKGQLFTPINFYITQSIGEKLAVGLGVNNQYGLGTKWGSEWAGKYLALNTEIVTFFITPVIAYELFDGFSVSAGGSFVLGDVTIERKVNAIPGLLKDAELSMKGDGTSFGFTAGLLYKVNDQFQVGANYRSAVKIDFSGTAATTPATFYHPQLKVDLPYPTGDITAPLETPQNLTLGLAWMPSDAVTFTADYQYVGWSSYDKMEVTFATYDLDLNPANGLQNVSTAKREYQNTYILRAGLEYNISDKAAVRFGLVYDHNPVKTEYVDPTLPDADRIGLNVGFGGKLTENLGVDFAYMLLTFSDRTVSKSVYGFNGTYSNLAHLFGVNFSYSL
ncbi:MAG: outer membrane protein transport protein [Melioribacteraceae bacterium]